MPHIIAMCVIIIDKEKITDSDNLMKRLMKRVSLKK